MEDKTRKMLQLLAYILAEMCVISLFIYFINDKAERWLTLGCIMFCFNAHTRIIYFVIPEAKYLIADYTQTVIEAIVLAAAIIVLLLCTFAKEYASPALQYSPAGFIMLYIVQVATITWAFVNIIFNEKIDLLIPPEDTDCVEKNIA